MEFIFGCICGAAAAVICALGASPAKRRWEDVPPAAAAEDAFCQLQNYSAEQAYGMGGEHGCIR